MENRLSRRLADVINALPLFPGIRVLEVGCGPGAAAREIAQRIGNGYILGIDRSEKAIQLAVSNSQEEIKTGKLAFLVSSIETFSLEDKEELFDLAFAVRVGALDGRHLEMEKQALTKIAMVLKENGKLFIDGGSPLKEIPLDAYR